MWAEYRKHVILEDDAILVLDKPVGVSVMGERHESDLVRMAEEAGERLFPVHRIDKVTSGVVLFAKDLAVHGGLTRQFNKRTVDKAYLAITRPGGLPPAGRIDLPLSVGRKNRVRIAAPRESIVADLTAGTWTVPAGEVFDQVPTYPSVTTFEVRSQTAETALVEAYPLTGRRHQIRVHLAWIGHPIVGDPLFDKHATGRTYLHSWRLAFDLGGRRVSVEAPPSPSFLAQVADGN
ncbi:RNA pseudouridine synthase [Dactylosporangium sp. AC04546]|uniref:RluA family pseudouridine synthase n=1 Tax=Dactylosporangium sp. AC04546 TaxID=2862460 RepID=UPI001EDD9DE2|nr:RNA pseudouridine synthase [Dactylosporangium sp. AC04546]WVK83301.1 RNA pseudouridine synthase [Dactylosporangium sp. AC04546]